MRQTIWTVNEPSNPQAFITKGKQRVKQFEGQVYLKDGDEFEIELFNTNQKHILAKIKIDGEYLSGGGIVLRPGERVFLERHLDTAKKFVFRTYEVGKEAVNLGAIDNNGYVEVQFFNEFMQTTTPYWGPNTFTLNGGITYTTHTPQYLSGTAFTTSGTTNAFYNQSLTTSNSNIKTFVNTSAPLNAGNVLRSTNIETGRTEKGSDSNQKLKQSDKEFSSISFHNVVWRILPTSVKQYHREELSIAYCGECGAKRKKDTFKFCPHCGTKF